MSKSAAPLQVLIAEDDEDDYDIFVMAVAEILLSIEVKHARDGNSLISLLTRSLPDILFLDLRMQPKDGRACLQEIRADRRYDCLPVIVLSALDDSETIEYCFQTRANSYVVKPPSVKELRHTLETIFLTNWKNGWRFPPRSEFVLSNRI